MSELSTVEADIRICPRISHPLRDKRLFVGLHLDFSMHQMILYLGICSLFVEVYGIRRTEATIDSVRQVAKCGNLDLVWHYTNHKPHDYFFNIGITYYEGSVIVFFWKLQLSYN